MPSSQTHLPKREAKWEAKLQQIKAAETFKISGPCLQEVLFLARTQPNPIDYVFSSILTI